MVEIVDVTAESFKTVKVSKWAAVYVLCSYVVVVCLSRFVERSSFIQSF